MPALPQTRSVEPAGRPEGATVTEFLLPVLLIAAVLYFAREILVPLALAILLSFVLAPLLRKLQKWRIPRGVAVPVVVLIAFAVVFGLGALVAMQVTTLASDLPRYQTTLREKVQDLKGMTAGQGTLTRAAAVLQSLSREIAGGNKERRSGSGAPDGQPAASDVPVPPAPAAASPQPSAPPAPPPETRPEPKPIPVEVHPPEATGIETLQSLLGPLIHPIATTGLIIIFVVFILLQREDLRNRLIRLAGAQDIQRTTAAIDDAAHRLSRLYLVQLALNGSFGCVIALGLWLIGIPSPVLWGVLAAVLRFVPYVGAIISAVFPLILAVAVDPGWSAVLWTALLFAVVEPLLGHVVEPLVQGHSTGLSPVAIVISAAFWTWLWGPIGLILATPLTVCLVVLGRHVERLQSLDVMFGDRPPLSPQEVFYQRMLAGDPLEAADQAEAYLADHTLLEYYDEIGLGGLRLALADHNRSTLSETQLENIRSSVHELVDDLAQDETGWLDRLRGRDADTVAEEDGIDMRLLVRPNERGPSWQGDTPVLCIAGRSPLDEAGAHMLAHAFTEHGLGARAEGPDALSSAKLFQLDPKGVAMVCLSYVDLRGEGSMRYAVKRVRRRIPDASVVVCYWSAAPREDMESLRRVLGADAVVTTIAGSLALARDAAVAGAEPSEESPEAVAAEALARERTDERGAA